MLGIKRITGAADLASEGEPGSWVSDAAREAFMAAYERVFALWPQPCEELDIETATATTRVHAYRPHPGGDPVVLLAGAGGALITPAQARDRGSVMPHTEVAIVPGSHGGFDRVAELNARIAAFISAQGADQPGSAGPAARN